MKIKKKSRNTDTVCIFCGQNKLNILGQGDLIKYKLIHSIDNDVFLNDFKQFLSNLNSQSDDKSLNK